MKKLTLALLALAFVFSINLGYAQDKKETKNTKDKKVETTTAKLEVTKGTGKPVNSVCIVSGEELDAKVTADYNGKTYGFCCKTCLKKFTKDPEKYVTKFEKKSNK
jgi:YHS domain-containing protein